MAKRYSVYETDGDRPFMIWGSAQECAAALGVSLNSFYTYVTRAHRGCPVQKYEIIEHTEKEEDVLA